MYIRGIVAVNATRQRQGPLFEIISAGILPTILFSAPEHQLDARITPRSICSRMVRSQLASVALCLSEPDWAQWRGKAQG